MRGFVLKVASAFWRQQPIASREYASKTIIPACDSVNSISISAKDLIEKEVSAFSRALDCSLFMLPSTPQVLQSFSLIFFQIFLLLWG